MPPARATTPTPCALLIGTKRCQQETELTKLGNKKRVRRIHVELSQYREQVQTLELQLTRYKLRKTDTSVHSLCGSSKSQNGDADFGVWNGLAERQLKERLRAEQQLQDLEQSEREMLQLFTDMNKLLLQWNSSENTIELIKRDKKILKVWDLTREDEVFSELLVTAAKLHLQQIKIDSPSKTINFSSDLTMGKDVAKLDPSVKAGVVFHRKCGVLLPFELDVVIQAYWRFFQCEQSTKQSEPGNLAALFSRSFSVRTDFDGFSSEVQGKYTCRKRVNADAAVLTWAGFSNLLEFGGVRFSGMQPHKQGSINLRKVACKGRAPQSNLTVVEANFKTTPVFLDGVNDQPEQTVSLIDSFESSYCRVNNIFCHIMGNLLVQEDWKAMFGRD